MIKALKSYWAFTNDWYKHPQYKDTLEYIQDILL